MKIYITTQGARIIREGRHLLVKKGDDTYHTLFVEKLEQVVLLGNIEVTASARRVLLQNHVDTVFLTKYGRYLGRFSLAEPKNMALRQKQFHLLDNDGFGLETARSIVQGKLANMMTLLGRIKRTRGVKEAGLKAKEIKKLLAGLSRAESVDSIRGYEGKGSAFYFSAFRFGFLQDQQFYHRVRRPPTDPVNAVLSLLYTFLFNRVYAAVRLNHLDPYPAFLHVPDYGRHSLVMDLMEEFRVIIVDSLTLSLFNLNILNRDDFIIPKMAREDTVADAPDMPDVTKDGLGQISDSESGEFFDVPSQRMEEKREEKKYDKSGKLPVQLTPPAMHRVIENFERKLTTEFHYEPYDRKIIYGEALIAQAGLFRKYVEGEINIYEPLLLK